MAFEHELQVATALAKDAGALILKYFGQPVPQEQKADDSPVTKADKEANALIVAGLEAAFPDDLIIAEESELPSERTKARRVWSVDPLDGTKEFIDHLEMYVVMIGLAVDGEAILGVVYQPNQDWLCVGGPDGASMTKNGDNLPVKLTTRDSIDDTTLCVSRSHPSRTLNEIAGRYTNVTMLPVGSVGLKIAHVLAGDADAYISTADRMKEWDTCAPKQFSAQQAGSSLTALGHLFATTKRISSSPTASSRQMAACTMLSGESWSRCVKAAAGRDVNPSNNGQKLQFADASSSAGSRALSSRRAEDA